MNVLLRTNGKQDSPSCWKNTQHCSVLSNELKRLREQVYAVHNKTISMYIRNIFGCFLIIVGQSCHTPTNLQAERGKILLLQEQQRRAHLEKNVDLLLSDRSRDFIEINRGIINTPTRVESITRFKTYFDSVEFIKWDDLSPPVISFSGDATMATAAVNKLVITKKIKDGRLDTAYFAWLAVYKKNHGKWELHQIVSTNK